HYQEAVRRGGALLTVDVVDDTQMDAVRLVLERAGAVDIDERVTQWQSTGYTGYQGASLSSATRPYSTTDSVTGAMASPDAMDATASTACGASDTSHASHVSGNIADEKSLPVV